MTSLVPARSVGSAWSSAFIDELVEPERRSDFVADQVRTKIACKFARFASK